MIVDTFAGPGGWDEACVVLGLGPVVGIEWDRDACRTRAAAGHLTIRADVAQYPCSAFRGLIVGLIGSPPCTLWSAAGTRHGVGAVDLLAPAMFEVLRGNDVRAGVRAKVADELRPQIEAANARRKKPKNAEQLAREVIDVAYLACLVLEPARWIAETNPEWVALEQVKEVLPLWQVLAHGLRQMGYSVWTGILDSADFGTPQNRDRAILMASRVRTVTPPEPTHGPEEVESLFGAIAKHVSMAEGLGWGLTKRPSSAVMSTSASGGGPRPIDGGEWSRGRVADAIEAGEWVDPDGERVDPATILVGFARLDDGRPGAEPIDGYRERDFRSADRPAQAVTEKARSWVRVNTGRDWKPGGTREDAQEFDPAARPAPAVTRKSGETWLVRDVGEDEDDAAGTQVPGGNGVPGSIPGEPGGSRPQVPGGNPAASRPPERARCVCGDEHDVVGRYRGAAVLACPQVPDGVDGYISAPNDTWELLTGNNSMVTGRTGSHAGDGDVQPYRRAVDRPAPTLDTNVGSKWVLVPGGLGYANGKDEGDLPGVNRRTYDPEFEPAPTIAFGHDAANWQWRERFIRGEPDNPGWPAERPSTTVAGDYRIAQPGHKNDKASPGSPGRMEGAIGLTVEEAALLQSFRRGYPWQGTKTSCFHQVGNAIPVRLAAAVVGTLVGAEWSGPCDRYRDAVPG